MNDIFDFNLKHCFNIGAEIEEKEPPCQGVFFRYTENNYYTNGGGKFVIQKQISLLKKMSCPGCSECGWVFDDARQGMVDRGDTHFEFTDGLKHGDIVTLEFVVDGYDWEMGYVDDSHLKVVKVTPAQNSSS